MGTVHGRTRKQSRDQVRPLGRAAAGASLKYFLEGSGRGTEEGETVFCINIKFLLIVSRVP